MKTNRIHSKAFLPIAILLLISMVLFSACGKGPATNGPGTGGENTAGTSGSQISGQDALRILEDKYGEKDEETGNKFSWAFEDIITIEGKEYYNFRLSWTVDEGTEGEHMSYVTNLGVSMDGKEIIEIPKE